jgi:hypothetical protein
MESDAKSPVSLFNLKSILLETDSTLLPTLAIFEAVAWNDDDQRR